jgi:hypothetical protein
MILLFQFFDVAEVVINPKDGLARFGYRLNTHTGTMGKTPNFILNCF